MGKDKVELQRYLVGNNKGKEWVEHQEEESKVEGAGPQKEGSKVEEVGPREAEGAGERSGAAEEAVAPKNSDCCSF